MCMTQEWTSGLRNKGGCKSSNAKRDPLAVTAAPTVLHLGMPQVTLVCVSPVYGIGGRKPVAATSHERMRRILAN